VSKPAEQNENAWFSEENLQKAFRYAMMDTKDDFVFDVLNHWDVRLNRDYLLKTLSSQLEYGQYSPSRLVEIEVPKNNYSVRPGSTVSLPDLVVLFAIVQVLAPHLDAKLLSCVYSYRLNPKRGEKDEHLFLADKAKPEQKTESPVEADDEFPSSWFPLWKKFHEDSVASAKSSNFCAVTDITAYFENIQLDRLRDRIRSLLSPELHELVDILFSVIKSWNLKLDDHFAGSRGLPQGNDVSSFLSNIYLSTVDEVLFGMAKGNQDSYRRYVDDIKLYTDDEELACSALVETAREMRRIGLNLQSAKTKPIPAAKVFDVEGELWLEKLDDEAKDRKERAVEWLTVHYEKTIYRLTEYHDKIFRRTLTVLREANDESATEKALQQFLSQPEAKMLRSTFFYLKWFSPKLEASSKLAVRLNSTKFSFPYHVGQILRLATYLREPCAELSSTAESFATDANQNWFVKMSALFYLSQDVLDAKRLQKLHGLYLKENDPHLLRAFILCLVQYDSQQLLSLLQRFSFNSVPQLALLVRYTHTLASDRKEGAKLLAEIKKASISDPNFLFRLHQLDLLKVNKELRIEFKATIEQKLGECRATDVRLKSRLQSIFDSFVKNA
jgi:Reverse transcriptase (RNA-dependent DNA polymerase)